MFWPKTFQPKNFFFYFLEKLDNNKKKLAEISLAETSLYSKFDRNVFGRNVSGKNVFGQNCFVPNVSAPKVQWPKYLCPNCETAEKRSNGSFTVKTEN